jgi:hypothetical protein
MKRMGLYYANLPHAEVHQHPTHESIVGESRKFLALTWQLVVGVH